MWHFDMLGSPQLRYKCKLLVPLGKIDTNLLKNEQKSRKPEELLPKEVKNVPENLR